MSSLLMSAMAVAAAVCGTLAADYCSTDTVPPPADSPRMYFTKEPVPLEYGFQGSFKSIHCCVKGYRSIEWFKDGVAYPWSAGVSNLILYPEEANQTLYSQRAASADSGNYTCRLNNDTHTETHTIRLHVLDKSPGAPRTMFISSDQWLAEGDQLRLYCEALIGRPYLADAHGELGWRRVWPNDTEGELPDPSAEQKTVREKMREIIGSYLRLERVADRDFGRYVCLVHNNDFTSRNYVTVHRRRPNDVMRLTEERTEWRRGTEIPWRALVLCGVGVAVLLASGAALHARCTPRLLLAVRHARARLSTSAHAARVLEKEFDVLVCWTRVDESLVRGALLPTLAHKYKYRVHALRLPNQPDTWYEELAEESKRCRSLVAVVSPAQLSPAQLLLALRQLRALPLPPVVVLLQDLPKLKREAKESGESLVGLLRRTRLVPWRHLHERAFWTALRLALPVPPQAPLTPPCYPSKAEAERVCSRSGSRAVLV